MKNYVIALLIFFLSITGVPAQTNSNEEIVVKLDEYLISAHNAYRFTGSALVIYKGKVLLNKGYGFSNFKTRLRNNPNTRFPLLSVGKSMTATIILKLQEAGQLSVEDNLSKYFPEYPNGNKIRIYHLLTHTSGIYNYTDDVGVEDSAITNYPIAKQTVMDHFMNKAPNFAPGKRYSYCNSGYFLLGLIIEKVTGKPFESVIREVIFNPIGMTQSGFDFLSLDDSVKATGYQFWNELQLSPYKFYDSTFAYSAGSVYTTTNDMVKWATAVSSQQILSPKSWEMAFTPRKSPYGYGWQTGHYYKKKYVKHSGGYPGFMSEFIYYPEQDLIIVLLNNFGNYGQNVWSTGMGLSSIAMGLPYDLWKLRKEIKLSESVLSNYVGVYRGSIMDEKRKISILLKNDKLILDNLGQVQLLAESKHDFYVEYFNTQFSFREDIENRIMKLTIHEHGRDHKLVRKIR